MKNKKKTILMIATAILVIIVIFLIIVFTGKAPKKETKKIGFIMSGNMDESGWNGMHYQGVKKACNELGVELIVKENIKEYTGECNKAIKELVDAGAEMIILSSYNYSEEAVETVKKYPDITFYGNSSEYHEKNLTSYFVRMYQARYLAGIMAGMRTQSNQIGYVAAMSNNEVNRGINAFALGVQRVNPEAKVIVTWTDSWDDKQAETISANTLIQEKQVDVITYHQNQSFVIDAAEAAGIDSIGYHKYVDNVSSRHLSAVVCDWELAYKEIVQQFLRGKGNSTPNYWIGLEEQVVGLSPYSDVISEDIKKEIELATTEILSGKDVFSGVIYDTKGTLRCHENEKISDEVLLEQFDWFVEGVEIYEK